MWNISPQVLVSYRIYIYIYMVEIKGLIPIRCALYFALRYVMSRYFGSHEAYATAAAPEILVYADDQRRRILADPVCYPWKKDYKKFVSTSQWLSERRRSRNLVYRQMGSALITYIRKVPVMCEKYFRTVILLATVKLLLARIRFNINFGDYYSATPL